MDGLLRGQHDRYAAYESTKHPSIDNSNINQGGFVTSWTCPQLPNHKTVS